MAAKEWERIPWPALTDINAPDPPECNDDPRCELWAEWRSIRNPKHVVCGRHKRLIQRHKDNPRPSRTIYIPVDLDRELSRRPGINPSEVCLRALWDAVLAGDRNT